MARALVVGLILLAMPRSLLVPLPPEPVLLVEEALPAPTGTMVASYYHPALNGRRTASGAFYDQRRLTAAHRTLPFGTRLRLAANGSTVEVVVTDRGPFWPGRDLDLSRAAARRLGMLKEGVVEVSCVIL